MAVHSISVKNLVSRVREIFPDVPENYIIMLINDALVELGLYNIKNMKAKLDTNILLNDATNESAIDFAS